MKYLRKEAEIKKIGLRIRSIRKSKGISMEQLSFHAGIEYSQLSRIERGIINTSVSQLLVIAESLKVSPKDFF